MITVKVTTTGEAEARAFVINLSESIARPQALNQVLADRLADELRTHFSGKGRRPGSIASKLNAPDSNFWKRIAAATRVNSVTDSGAKVVVGTNQFNIHLFGGTILPGPGKKALTIPLVAEAVGKRARNYEADTGKKLFTIRGKKALFERTGTPTGEALVGRVRRRNGTSKSVGLVTRTGVRPVFALVNSAKIKRDDDALPPDGALLNALQEEADDFITRLNAKGGLG